MKPHVFRRIWIVDPKFQMRYVFWISCTGLILSAMYSLIFYYYVRENYMLLIELAPMTNPIREQLVAELRETIGIIAFLSGAFLLFITAIGVVFSNHTAGPMHRLKRAFRSVRDGQYDLEIHFRKNDDFLDVAEEFNEMVRAIKKRHQSIGN